jgi:hypothetical protein
MKSFHFGLLIALGFVFVGCDAAKQQAGNMANQASSAVAEKGKELAAKAGDMTDLLSKANESLGSVEGGSEMLQKVQDSFGSLTKIVTGIKDEATAKSALPDLGGLTDSFGGMTDGFQKLPAAAKGIVAKIFESSVATIKPLIDKAMELPGVGAILKPAIETLMSKLGEFKA